MKFTADAKTFAVAMASLQKISERRNNIPILSNAVISAEKDSISLRATDLDMEMTMSIAAQVAASGSTTVPAALLSDILRKMAAGEVTFESDKDGQVASVGAGRSKFRLQTLPETDYPVMSNGNYTHTIEFAGDVLLEALSKVQFAISTEETRYYLNGVHWNHDGEHPGAITFVATDGHRLAKSFRAPDGDVENFPPIIVPRKTVGEIITLAKSAGAEPVKIEVSENKIRITAGTTVLTSKLIDGTFPDYRRVIPALTNQIATVESKVLSASADRVTTISSERGRAVKLTFEETRLSLAVNNPDSGSAEEDIDIGYSGAKLEIGFNAKYLSDICSVIGAGEVRISLTDAGSPTVITTDKDPAALYVLMPMRV
ncbi:DNA polymerase III subunit beta [Mesorhizobium sp. M0189]|uniref:DNA polymerase III subunit beta n=1 Tax=Mesorhizobium sp. M0189 TaxID=2956909 RepID=UPI00333C4949